MSSALEYLHNLYNCTIRTLLSMPIPTHTCNWDRIEGAKGVFFPQVFLPHCPSVSLPTPLNILSSSLTYFDTISAPKKAFQEHRTHFYFLHLLPQNSSKNFLLLELDVLGKSRPPFMVLLSRAKIWCRRRWAICHYAIHIPYMTKEKNPNHFWETQPIF